MGAREEDTRFITRRLRLFPRGITQSLRVRAGMQRDAHAISY